jgi:hypothetical protein
MERRQHWPVSLSPRDGNHLVTIHRTVTHDDA